MSTYTKDPGAKLDYGFDWSAWLDGDTITASTWTVPAGLTKVTDSRDATTTTVWLLGGVLNERYTVTNQVTTAAGRIDERSLRIQVRDR